jgi:transposase-like protein
MYSSGIPMAKPKKVLTCPQCGSASLYYEAGLVTGQKYHCKDCDYVGAFVIEKDIPDEKERGQG